MGEQLGFKCAYCNGIIFVDVARYVGEYVICPHCHTEHTLDYRIYAARSYLFFPFVSLGLIIASIVTPIISPLVRQAFGLSNGFWGSLQLTGITVINALVGLIVGKTVLMVYIWPAVRGRDIYFVQNPKSQKETFDAFDNARKVKSGWIGVEVTHEQMSFCSTRVQFAACGGDAVCLWCPIGTLLIIAAIYIISLTQITDPFLTIRFFWILGPIVFVVSFLITLVVGWVVLNRGILKHVSVKL